MDTLVPVGLEEVLGRITDSFVACDSEWRMTYLNEAAERLARRPRSELIGRVVWEEFPDLLGTIFEREYRRALSEQTPVAFEAYYAPLDVWIFTRAFPSRSGLTFYTQDITTRKRAEQALAESEARYRLIAETANEAIWLVDAEYRHVWGNPRLAEFFGVSLDALKGRQVHEFVFEDDLPELRRQIQQRRSGRSDAYDIRMKRANGELVWSHARISPVIAPDGSFRGALGMLTDISARKRFEQELQEQREWLRVTLSSIGDAVIATDVEGRVMFMNDVAEQLTGWSRADAAGSPLDVVFNIVNEKTGERAENPVEKVLREGRVVGLANHTALIARDRVVRTIDDSAAPIRNGAGELMGVVLVFRDATERARAERALRESEERFRSLCACSPVGIFVMDGEGRIAYVNPSCEAICPGAFSPAGGDWLERVHPEERARARDQWSQGQHLTEPVRFMRADGSSRWGVIYSARMYADDGRLIGRVGVVEDVTEQHESAAALRRADRRKDEFLAMLGHELRNPLAPLLSAIEALRMKPDDPATATSAHAVIERQIQHITRLVDDLLDVSRITRGVIQLRKEGTTLGALLARTTESVQPLLAQRRQELLQRVAAGSARVEVDPTRFVQIISNLLHNASKFSPEGGRLELETEVAGQELVVTVRDHGCGIAPEVLPHVFDLFVQADSSLDRAGGGLGIGLTLVKKLVELHGGDVAAYSDGVGKGSTFTVRMPVVMAESRAAAASAHSTPDANARGQRVLVVDDNRDAREMLAMLLQMLGYSAVTAADGASALEAARDRSFDAVLLDIGLPLMDGYEVARRLRMASRRAPRLIALSGYGQEEDVRRSREAGFDLHLVKPVDVESLDRSLRALLTQ